MASRPKGIKRSLNCFDLSATALAVGIYDCKCKYSLFLINEYLRRTRGKDLVEYSREQAPYFHQKLGTLVGEDRKRTSETALEKLRWLGFCQFWLYLGSYLIDNLRSLRIGLEPFVFWSTITIRFDPRFTISEFNAYSRDWPESIPFLST